MIVRKKTVLKPVMRNSSAREWLNFIKFSFYFFDVSGTSITSLRNNGSSSETQTKQRQQHHPKARESQVHNINIHLHGKLNIYLLYLL